MYLQFANLSFQCYIRKVLYHTIDEKMFFQESILVNRILDNSQ